MPELTAPVLKADQEQRIVYGPVLVPNEPDSDGDVVTPEKIEAVAHKFMADYGNIDLQHSLNNVGRVVESYICPIDWTPSEGVSVPQGSWIMGVKVQDEETWNAVKSGALTGFSIMGISKAAFKSAAGAEKSAAYKRTTLADLGEDWIVNAVSLVDEPAVPKAKFLVIKSKAKKAAATITAETVEKAIAGSLEAREQIVRGAVYSTFDTETTDSYVASTFQDSVIIKLNNMITGNSRLIQLGYTLDEQGNVTFVGDPVEVTIQETVVPVAKAKEDDAAASHVAEKTHEQPEAQKGLFARIMDKLGWTGKAAEKAGRSISDSNYQKLKAAQEVIAELLGVAEAERANKSKEGDEMNKEEVQALIAEATKGLTDQIAELFATVKAEPKGEEPNAEKAAGKDEQQQGEPAAEKAGDHTNAANTGDAANAPANEQQTETVAKSEYDNVLQQLEALKKKAVPFSRRLVGQDGEPAEKAADDQPKRDAFGFKAKAKA